MPIYDDRSYEAFAQLANVRNDYNSDYISEPRGLPDDVSDIVKFESDEWAEDGHSHSWLTAREIFIWVADHPYKEYSGMVSPQEFELYYKYKKFPSTWCKWTSSKDYQYLTWRKPGSHLERLAKAIRERMIEVFDLYWREGEGLENGICVRADDFRIVFWFDN